MSSKNFIINSDAKQVSYFSVTYFRGFLLFCIPNRYHNVRNNIIKNCIMSKVYLSYLYEELNHTLQISFIITKLPV